MKPKTDSEILDYMEREKVVVIPPTQPDGKWRVCGRQSKRFYEAKRLRDAVMMIAYDNNEQD